MTIEQLTEQMKTFVSEHGGASVEIGVRDEQVEWVTVNTDEYDELAVYDGPDLTVALDGLDAAKVAELVATHGKTNEYQKDVTYLVVEA